MTPWLLLAASLTSAMAASWPAFPGAGRLTFTLPSAAGPYEVRYFLNDGFTRVSASGRIVCRNGRIAKTRRLVAASI